MLQGAQIEQGAVAVDSNVGILVDMLYNSGVVIGRGQGVEKGILGHGIVAVAVRFAFETFQMKSGNGISERGKEETHLLVVVLSGKEEWRCVPLVLQGSTVSQ